MKSFPPARCTWRVDTASSAHLPLGDGKSAGSFPGVNVAKAGSNNAVQIIGGARRSA
jgi:hypothetical protein